MRKTRLLLGVAIGASAEYLLDPQLVTRRRARLRDQAAARVRRARRASARRSSYERGQRAGEEARASGKGVFHPVSDRQVGDHLHETLSRLDFPTSDVTVEVADAIATLRGQVRDDDQRQQIIEAVRSHPGVDSVTSWLHLPGEPAPNKAAAYAASATSAR
jgi:osmotically-inducible protein OsmY